ncbi:MAG: LapA family protein, partial [Pseudomonadota bacterium]
TYLNDGDITLDIAFAEVTVSISFAFAVAIAIGWALGWLSAAVVLARAKADQFLLKRRLRHTRNELRDAKRLPGLD